MTNTNSINAETTEIKNIDDDVYTNNIHQTRTQISYYNCLFFSFLFFIEKTNSNRRRKNKITKKKKIERIFVAYSIAYVS